MFEGHTHARASPIALPIGRRYEAPSLNSDRLTQHFIPTKCEPVFAILSMKILATESSMKPCPNDLAEGIAPQHRTVKKETDECMALADIGTQANQTNPRFRASPGINVAFPDLVSEGNVWLQALVELNRRQLSLGGPSFHGDDHVGCSILCCRRPGRVDDQGQR
jgi:hypothetical protein